MGQETISETYTTLVGETGTVVKKRMKFGATKDIEILTMNSYVNENPFMVCSAGFTIGPLDVTVKHLALGPHIGLGFVGPLRVRANGFFWQFIVPVTDDVLRYGAVWRVVE